MTDCKALSSHRKDSQITKTNLFEVIPNTYELSPGTRVRLSCAPGLHLQGEPSFTCLPTGEWNYTNIPVCKETKFQDKPYINSTSGLIIVCVIWGLATLAVLALIFKIVAIIIRKRRENIDRHYNQRGSYSHHGERQGHGHSSRSGHGQNHDHGHGHNSAHGHGHRHEHGHGHNSSHGHRHRHEHGHGHNSSHGHGHNNTHGHGQNSTHGHGHHSTHGHGHNHENDHSHNSTHGHGHRHEHGHGHNSSHGHGDHNHSHGHRTIYDPTP